MPLSSKKIIRTIDELPSTFTRNDLFKRLLTADEAPAEKKGKRHKKKAGGTQSRDLSKIETTINL